MSRLPVTLSGFRADLGVEFAPLGIDPLNRIRNGFGSALGQFQAQGFATAQSYGLGAKLFR